MSIFYNTVNKLKAEALRKMELCILGRTWKWLYVFHSLNTRIFANIQAEISLLSKRCLSLKPEQNTCVELFFFQFWRAKSMCQKCERCVYVLSASVHETALTAFRIYRALTFTRHLLDVKKWHATLFFIKSLALRLFGPASTLKKHVHTSVHWCVCVQHYSASLFMLLTIKGEG